ncbi:MAG: archease [Chloroflexi bacterium]|nr:archease [Chloroflexota bacterium]
MEKEFEILDHTADVGIIAYGNDTSEAFANAAKGLFSLITELDDVAEIEYRDIELTAPDQESLLVAWLNELIYLFDAEQMLFKRFDITQLSLTHLKARSYGHKVDSAKHKLKIGVKAATYHLLKIEKSNGCKVQVLFDI